MTMTIMMWGCVHMGYRCAGLWAQGFGLWALGSGQGALGSSPGPLSSARWAPGSGPDLLWSEEAHLS